MKLFHGTTTIPDDHPLTRRWRAACQARNIFEIESREAIGVLRVLLEAERKLEAARNPQPPPDHRAIEAARQERLCQIVEAQDAVWGPVEVAIDLYRKGSHQPRLV